MAYLFSHMKNAQHIFLLSLNLLSSTLLLLLVGSMEIPQMSVTKTLHYFICPLLTLLPSSLHCSSIPFLSKCYTNIL